MLLVGITAIINLIAELVMLLMLATAPIFIYCLMWSWFRDMFSNWLRIILGCILTSLFSGIALTVVMDYTDYIGGRHKSIRCQLPDSGRSGLPRHGGCRRRDGPDL